MLSSWIAVLGIGIKGTEGESNRVMDTTCQLIRLVGVGIYNSMAYVNKMVGTSTPTTLCS